MGDNAASENAKRVLSVNLQFFLDAQGKTQADLVRDLGFKQATVSDWITCKKYPRVDKVQALADYFGVYKSALTEEHKKTPPAEAEGMKAEVLTALDCLPQEDLKKVFEYIQLLIKAHGAQQ